MFIKTDIYSFALAETFSYAIEITRKKGKLYIFGNISIAK